MHRSHLIPSALVVTIALAIGACSSSPSSAPSTVQDAAPIVGTADAGTRRLARPAPAPECLQVDRAILKQTAEALVAVHYEDTISKLVTADRAGAICALQAVVDVVAAGKTSGAPILTPIEERAQTMLHIHGGP